MTWPDVARPNPLVAAGACSAALSAGVPPPDAADAVADAGAAAPAHARREYTPESHHTRLYVGKEQ